MTQVPKPGFGRLARSRRRRSQSGHTLIEVMIASFVFSFGALGLIRMMYTSHKGITVAEKLTHATNLGRDKVDELLRLPYDHADLVTHAETTNIKEDRTAAGSFEDNDGYFARSWEVTEDASVGTGLKTILVTVKWYDKNFKRTRSVVVGGAKSNQ